MSRESQVIARKARVKQRALLLLGLVAFVASFQWMYVHYLYPTFDYFGFDYYPPPSGYLLLAWILSVLPGLWMPLELTRPSQLAYWVLYITVFIPSMFVPLFAGLSSAGESGLLMITFFAGFVILSSSYLLPLCRLSPARISRQSFGKIIGCLFIGLMLWMVVVFRHHIAIVSFQDVYDLREAANDVAEGSQVNYAFMMAIGAVNPFLMGYGLYFGRKRMSFIGILGQILLYGIGGSKGTILSILFVAGFYLLFRVGRIPSGLKLTFGALALLGAPCVSYALANYDPGPIHAFTLFLILQRTFAMGGLLTAQYYDFFQRNPLTYYSHIKGVSWFLPYPYRYPIGQEIGVAYAGTTNLDASAHFWATDGIAALGLPGIVLVSALCALIFWVLDSAAQRHDPRLGALVTSYAAFNLANISMFTSLLSGGLGLLILLLYLMPRGFGASVKPGTQKKKESIRGFPDRGLLSAPQ